MGDLNIESTYHCMSQLQLEALIAGNPTTGELQYAPAEAELALLFPFQ